MQRLAMVGFVGWMAACGGAQHSSTGSTSDGSGGTASSESPSDSPTQRRSGMVVHIQNMHAGGSLPAEADPQTDHLSVTFELALTHTGDQALTGIHITRARLVHDDGRAIVFGVLTDWDGRLEPGAERVIAYQKTPDSAVLPVRRRCSLRTEHARIEVTLDLAGRETTATSRHYVQDRVPAPVTGDASNQCTRDVIGSSAMISASRAASHARRSRAASTPAMSSASDEKIRW